MSLERSSFDPPAFREMTGKSDSLKIRPIPRNLPYCFGTPEGYASLVIPVDMPLRSSITLCIALPIRKTHNSCPALSLLSTQAVLLGRARHVVSIWGFSVKFYPKTQRARRQYRSHALQKVRCYYSKM
jgi:hypothetical protein